MFRRNLFCPISNASLLHIRNYATDVFVESKDALDELPKELNFDEFFAAEEKRKQTSPPFHVTQNKVMKLSKYDLADQKFYQNPFRLDKRDQPVWDITKISRFNEAKYPAIETEKIIIPKKKKNVAEEFRVRSLEEVKNAAEFSNGVKSSDFIEAGLPLEDSNIVKKIFSWENASKSQLNAKAVRLAIARFQKKNGDTGSTPVQIAVLTERINQMTDHLRKNRQDKVTIRTLQIIVHRRKKLLKYLLRVDPDAYWKTLQALDLRIQV